MDITIAEKRNYTLLLDNSNKESVQLITREIAKKSSDSNLVIIYREDLKNVINELIKCL